MLRTAAKALLLLVAVNGALDAQEAEYSERGALSPTLRASHWAVAAARRAESLGLAGSYLPAQRAVPRLAVRQALREAAERAWVLGPEAAELAAEWEHRFQREFPSVERERDSADGLLRTPNGAIGVAAGWRSGAVRAGKGLFPPFNVETLPDRAEINAELELAASLGPMLHMLLAPEIGNDGVSGSEWDVTLGWRRFALSAGRQPVLYGSGERAVVLGSPEPWHRIQLETVQPLTIPVLGSAAFHTSFGRISSERHPGDPFFWTASASLRPHPRLTLSANRAALLGGSSVTTPFTLWNFVRVVGGLHTQDFENQVVSLGMRYRIPAERWLALTTYLEWGFDDSAGAIRDVPGYVAGIFTPAVPGVPRVSAGVEHASFAHSCCGNPPWYRHAAFPGGWAHRDLPLGHPLGGEGTESLAWTRVDFARLPLTLHAAGWLRERGPENLYTPNRQGTSRGASAEMRWWGWSRTDASVVFSREAGQGWGEFQLRAGITRFF